MAIDIENVFAQNGDTTVVPQGTQIDGSVNFDEGYTSNYQLDPDTDPNALDIERNKMNYLFNVLFANQKELVKQGFNNHIVGKEYDTGNVVRGIDGALYQSLIDSNTDTPPSANWQEFGVTSLPSITGTLTTTNATNNINLAGVGDLEGLEIGDVIQMADSLSNNSEYTVEVITDSDNIIVNQAHAGGATTKSLVNETNTANVTIKILAKWYNAPIGLGQGWVDVLASRTTGVTYSNTTNRLLHVAIESSRPFGSVSRVLLEIDGVTHIIQRGQNSTSGDAQVSVSDVITIDSNYQVPTSPETVLVRWKELR